MKLYTYLHNMHMHSNRQPIFGRAEADIHTLWLDHFTRVKSTTIKLKWLYPPNNYSLPDNVNVYYLSSSIVYYNIAGQCILTIHIIDKV